MKPVGRADTCATCAFLQSTIEEQSRRLSLAYMWSVRLSQEGEAEEGDKRISAHQIQTLDGEIDILRTLWAEHFYMRHSGGRDV